jgi:hypothetical protein
MGRADEVEKRRFKMPFQYLLEHGVFLNALVAMKRSDGLLVLDGYHRVAALHALQLLPDEFFSVPGRQRPLLTQDVWVGVHRNRELPLT